MNYFSVRDIAPRRRDPRVMAPGLTDAQKSNILALLEAGKIPKAVATLGGTTTTTVYQVRKRAGERKGDITRARGQGRRPTQVTQAKADMVKKRVVRNPKRSIRGMAKDLGMSAASMSRVVAKASLRSRPMVVVHDIMPGQEARRLERAKKLLAWRRKRANKKKVVVWTDEKLFYVGQRHVAAELPGL